ncbi:MAG TPA: hypothetical protein VKV02_09590, partial [Acidobacteriaceae bacterium]|nr:hypothetical protein [Acidobacteriaceae bacterium]
MDANQILDIVLREMTAIGEGWRDDARGLDGYDLRDFLHALAEWADRTRRGRPAAATFTEGTEFRMERQMYHRPIRTERDWTTAAGLRAVVLLEQSRALDPGHRLHYCGYVEVPVGHPLHGVPYDWPNDVLPAHQRPQEYFTVTGGLLYSGPGTSGYPVRSEGWWFGFDCNPLWDLEPPHDRGSEDVVAQCEQLAA